MTQEKIILTVSYENHTDVVLTNKTGDTYTSRSEELMDFLMSSEDKGISVSSSVTENQIKEQEFRQASINRYGNDPNFFGAQRDGFIEGAKWMQEQDKWIELPAKELLPSGYYAIRISHNGFVDVKFEFIDNQIIPYHYATHYVRIVLPQPPKQD